MMSRHLIAGALALATILLAPTADARRHALARVKCAGMYCVIVNEPDPPPDRRPARRRHGFMRHRAAAHHLRHARAPARLERIGRHAPADASGASAPVAVARRYLGGNPTGWARAWCGVFMRLVMRAAGHPDLPSGNLAAAWARYGSASAPCTGAIVVWRHHVGLITAVHGNGLATVISGNDGRRVRERMLSIRGAIAFRGV